MFACLYSLTSPPSLLVKVAQDFTPRFEVLGPVVMLDLAGLSRLFGSPREIGEQLRQSLGGAPVRIAIAPSQTAAALLALGRPGLTVVSLEDQPGALAGLPVTLLGELERTRTSEPQNPGPSEPRTFIPPNVADMEDVLPYFQSCLERTSELARAPHESVPTGNTPPARATAAIHASASARGISRASYSAASPKPQLSPCGEGGNCGGGWMHPRDSHAATRVKRESASARVKSGELRRDRLVPPAGLEHAHVARPMPARSAARRKADSSQSLASLLETLRRWGIRTLGALAALPPGDVYERLGAQGVAWQRLARGDDQGPLVPCVPEPVFEGMLDLEWPIEGLEPLSFVLARLFEPLAERLERADRGAAILHTHLRLTTREVHARTLQLPAPMRDAKTLRTLVLLDLESNPPAAGIDRVRVLVEPTPARVVQWTLYERAQPAPEQVSTLLARLTALMGDGHVGSPCLVDSWRPGVFEMRPFECRDTNEGRRIEGHEGNEGCEGPKQSPGPTVGTALRRFRLPIPARVQMKEGRPVRMMVDRRGVPGGIVQQAAGPWRTSGEWWSDGRVGLVGQVGDDADCKTGPTHPTHQTHQTATAWDRDEWDVALTDGTVYRIYVERDVGQWFVEGIVD